MFGTRLIDSGQEDTDTSQLSSCTLYHYTTTPRLVMDGLNAKSYSDSTNGVSPVLKLFSDRQYC
jgi:hypothetical protein